MIAREIKQQQPTHPTIAGEVRVSGSAFFLKNISQLYYLKTFRRIGS